MLLRSRITLIVALGFGALTVGLGSASLVRDRLLEQRLAQTSIAAQSALWGEIVAVETGALGARAGAIAMNPAFGAALARGDRDDAARALASLGIDVGSADSIDFIAVIGADREPLYTAGKNAGLAVLDASTLDRVLTGQAAAGLRQASATQLPVIAASPLKIGDSPAALVVGRDVQHALRRYASRAGASVTLLTLRGRLAASTDPGLWQRAALSVSPRAALAEQVDFDNRIYSLISVPVRDIADGAVGAIVTLSDATDSLAASRWVGRLAIAGALLLALVGLALVNFYLWRSFRPLQAAIAALQALSRGDATVRLDAGGSDEIGRIAQAVAAFRMNAQELAASRALRERVRRRQESVIRRELHALADATDMTRRDEVLALLDGPASDSVAAAAVTQDRDDDQLRRLARIMGDLTRRIVDQHNSPVDHGDRTARRPGQQDAAGRPAAGIADRQPGAVEHPAARHAGRPPRQCVLPHHPRARSRRRLLRLLPDRRQPLRLRDCRRVRQGRARGAVHGDLAHAAQVHRAVCRFTVRLPATPERPAGRRKTNRCCS